MLPIPDPRLTPPHVSKIRTDMTLKPAETSTGDCDRAPPQVMVRVVQNATLLCRGLEEPDACGSYLWTIQIDPPTNPLYRPFPQTFLQTPLQSLPQIHHRFPHSPTDPQTFPLTLPTDLSYGPTFPPEQASFALWESWGCLFTYLLGPRI